MDNAVELLLASRLKLRGDLRFSLAEQRGQPVYLIEDGVRSKFFYVGIAEFQLMQKLDGQRTVADALALVTVSQANGSLDARQAIGVCQWLIQSNLVHSESAAMSERLQTQATRIECQRRLSWLNPLFLRLAFVHPNGFIKRITPGASWLFNRWCLAMWLVLAALALHCAVEHWPRISEKSFGVFAPNRWLWIMLGWLGLKLIHELAHAVACRKFGGDIGASGMQLILFVPLPFVDVTSSWRFRDRWQRIAVAAAGMYVELAIGFVALLVWARQPDGIVADICYNVFVLSALTTILFNANPLMKFDGYYILSDLLEIPNLYQRGQQAVRDWALHWLLGFDRQVRFDSIREGIAITAYGAISMVWRVTLVVGLLLVASTLLGGAGIAFAFVTALLWYGPSLCSIGKGLADRRWIGQVRPSRFAKSAAVLAILGALGALLLSAPARKSAACVVQFKDEHVLRAACDGFIQAIHVRDGQAIIKGQLLVELDNAELRLELHTLECKARQLEIRSRALQAAGKIAEYQAAQMEWEGVQRQLGEKQDQIAQMQVRSPIVGFVDRDQIENLIGSFVHQGDPIAIVSAAASKEVRISIPQSNFESLKHNLGDTVAVLLPGTTTIRTRLSSLDPHASEVPLHPSLGACYGGPLAVKARSENDGGEKSEFELLTPCFSATIDLDAATSSRVQSGQRGVVVLPSSQESLATHIYIHCRRWFYRKLGWHAI